MDSHPLTTTLVVPADATATRSARAVVRDLCTSASVGAETVETAVLLVTELVSNAIEHGGGVAVLDAVLDRSLLRVSVGDDDPHLPAVGPAEVDAEGGRGLLLVEALSSRWGTSPHAPGKTVWFELDCAATA